MIKRLSLLKNNKRNLREVEHDRKRIKRLHKRAS